MGKVIFALSINLYIFAQNFNRVGDVLVPYFVTSNGTMINAELIKGYLQAFLSENDLFLVDLMVRPGNRIIVYLDSMSGVTLEACRSASRFLESKLDREVEDFELEVSSPGLDRPLKLPVQFEKNKGRMLEVVKHDGIKITGRLLQAASSNIQLETEIVVKDAKTGKKKRENKVQEIQLDEIKTAKVVISLKK